VSAAPSTIHHFQQVRVKRKSWFEVNPLEAPVTVSAPKRPRFNLDA